MNTPTNMINPNPQLQQPNYNPRELILLQLQRPLPVE